MKGSSWLIRDPPTMMSHRLATRKPKCHLNTYRSTWASLFMRQNLSFHVTSRRTTSQHIIHEYNVTRISQKRHERQQQATRLLRILELRIYVYTEYTYYLIFYIGSPSVRPQMRSYQVEVLYVRGAPIDVIKKICVNIYILLYGGRWSFVICKVLRFPATVGTRKGVPSRDTISGRFVMIIHIQGL